MAWKSSCLAVHSQPSVCVDSCLYLRADHRPSSRRSSRTVFGARNLQFQSQRAGSEFDTHPSRPTHHEQTSDWSKSVRSVHCSHIVSPHTREHLVALPTRPWIQSCQFLSICDAVNDYQDVDTSNHRRRNSGVDTLRQVLNPNARTFSPTVSQLWRVSLNPLGTQGMHNAQYTIVNSGVSNFLWKAATVPYYNA